MAVIGKVSIKVYPDTDGFGRTTRASIERQLAKEKPRVEVIPDVDPDNLDDELKDAIRVVKGRVRAQPNRYKVTVPVDVDYDVDEEELDRKLDRAISDPKDQRVTRKIHVDTDVDDDRARDMADKVLDGTQRGIDKRDPLVAKLTPELDREKLSKALSDLEDARRESSERQAKQNLDAWQSRLQDAAGDDDLHPWFGDSKRRLEAAKRLGEAYRKEYEDGWRKAAYNSKRRAEDIAAGRDPRNDYYSKFSFRDEAFHDAWKDYEADRDKWSGALQRQLDEMHEKTREAIGDGIRTGLVDASRHLDDWQTEALDASDGRWDWEHPWLDDPKRGLEAARRRGKEFQEEYTKGWTASRRSGHLDSDVYERYGDRPDAFHAGWTDYAADYAKWTAPLREALHEVQVEATRDGVRDGLKKAKATQRKGLTELLDEARDTMDSAERENPIFSRTISPVFDRDEATKLSRAMRMRMQEQPDIPVRTSGDFSPLTESLDRELRRREFMIRLGIDDDAIDRLDQKLRERKLRIDVDLDDKALNRLKGRLADRRLKVNVDVDDAALDKLDARTKALKDHNIKVGLGLKKGAAAKLLAEATAAVKKVEKALPKLRAPLRAQATVDKPSLKRAAREAGQELSGLKWARIPVILDLDREKLNKTLRDALDTRRRQLRLPKVDVSLVADGERFFETLRSRLRAQKLHQEVELDVNERRFSDKVRQLVGDLRVGFRRVGVALERPFNRSMDNVESRGLRTAARLKDAFSKATAASGTGFTEGLRRMSGLRLARNLASDTWEPLSNFDIHMPKMMIMSAVLNQAAAAVGSLTSNLLALGRDTARILPGFLALPGAFTSLAVGALSAAFGLKDLGKVMPIVAQTFGAIPKLASSAFWLAARDPSLGLRDNLVRLGTAFQEGFTVSSAAAGKWFATWAKGIDKHLTPALGGMFKGVADAFKELETGGEGFAKILKELGGLGSRFAPDMSRWLADGMNTFGNWLEKKRLTGELDEMVKTAWEKTKDLGAVVRETYGFLDRLSALAERAGGASLRSLAEGIERINRALDRPEVAITVERLFRAAHETTQAFGSAIKGGLGDFLYMVGEIASDFGPKLAGTAGGLLGGLFEGLASPAMAKSLRNFANEFQKLGDVIRPVLVQSGEVAGILDTINAAIEPFGKLGAVAVGGVLDLIDDLGPYLSRAVRELGNGAVDLAKAVFGPLTEAGKNLGPMISGVATEIGGLARRLAPEIEGALSGLPRLVENLGTSFQRFVSEASDLIVKIFDGFGPAAGDFLAAAGTTMGTLVDSFTDALDDIDRLIGGKVVNWEFLFGQLESVIAKISLPGAINTLLFGDKNDAEAQMRAGATVARALGGESGREYAKGMDEALRTYTRNSEDHMLKLDLDTEDANQQLRELKGQIDETKAALGGSGFDGGGGRGGGGGGSWGVDLATGKAMEQLNDLQAGIRQTRDMLGRSGFDGGGGRGGGGGGSWDVEIDVEANTEEAEERLRQLEQALTDVQNLSAKGMEMDMSKLISGINTAIPALDEAWSVMGKTQAQSDSMASTLSSAMGSVQSALELTGISMGDFTDKSSAAWEAARTEGGAKLKALEGAYGDLRSAMDQTGITSDGLRRMLAMPGLSASAKGEISALLGMVESAEKGFYDGKSAAEGFSAGIDSIPGNKTIEIDTKVKPLSYDDIMSNIYAGKSPTAGWAGAAGPSIEVMVRPKVDTAAIPTALAGVSGEMVVTPKLDAAALSGIRSQITSVTATINVTITPGAAAALDGVSGAIKNLRANIAAGVGAPALGSSLAGIAGPSIIAINSLGNVASKAIDTAGKINQASGQSSIAMSNMARNISGHTQSITNSFRVVSSQASQMANGVANAGSRAVGSMRTTASGIRGAVSNVSLYSAGSAIGASLVRGLNSQRNAVASAARSLGATIKNNKGPIEKDRVMLVPEGIAIVEGLVAGLRDAEGRLLIPAVREMTSDLRAEATFTSFGERLGEAVGDGMEGALQNAIKDARETAIRGLDGVSGDLTQRSLSDGDAMIADLMKFMAPVLEMEKHAGNLLNGQNSMVSSTPMQTASNSGPNVEINNYWAKDDDTATATAKSAHLATLYLG